MTNSEVLARLWREAPEESVDERWLEWWVENGWSPDITWRAIAGAPDDVGLIEGRERLRRHYEEWLELFQEIKIEIRAPVDVGEKVVACFHLTAQSRSTGMLLEIGYAVVHELDPSGRIVAGREYATEAEAVRAAETAPTHHDSTIQS